MREGNLPDRHFLGLKGVCNLSFYFFAPCSSLLCCASSDSVLNFSWQTSHLNFLLLKKLNFIDYSIEMIWVACIKEITNKNSFMFHSSVTLVLIRSLNIVIVSNSSTLLWISAFCLSNCGIFTKVKLGWTVGRIEPFYGKLRMKTQYGVRIKRIFWREEIW